MGAPSAAAPPSDELLASQAASGNRPALEELALRYQGRLMRFALRQCNNPDRAADAVQDSMLAMVKALPKYRGESAFGTWLFTILRHACHRRARLRKNEPAFMETLDPANQDGGVAQPEGADAVTLLENRELGDALEHAMSTLDPKSREVVLLRDVEGIAAADVATITGLSVQAVKSRLHRARLQLRDQLGPAPGEGTSACQDVVRLFSRHLEGEIDSKVCQRMQSHVDGCERCRSQCQSLRAVLAQCAAVPVQLTTKDQQRVRHAVRMGLAAFGPPPPP